MSVVMIIIVQVEKSAQQVVKYHETIDYPDYIPGFL